MLPYDPTNESTLRKSGKSNEYNAAHLSCLFDLKKRIYTDAKIQPLHKKDEHKALQYMVDQYNGPANTILSWTGDMNAIIQLHTLSKKACIISYEQKILQAMVLLLL